MIAGLVMLPFPAAAAEEQVQKQQPADQPQAKPDGKTEEGKKEETKPRTEEAIPPPTERVTDPSFNTLEDIYRSPVAVALLLHAPAAADPDARQSTKVLWQVVD